MEKQFAQSGKAQYGGGITLAGIGKAILMSYFVTIPVFVVFAIILTYTDFPEKLVVPVVVITSIISVLIAGAKATRGVMSKGWLNGSIVGFIYILILYILSSIIYNNYRIDKYVITMTAISVLTGAIGGILGINMKSGHSKSRYKNR